MADAIAGRILKIDPEGKVVGSFAGPQPGQGPHFDPHEIALDRNCKTVYLSWDAASWHISKDLFEHIERRNNEGLAEGYPIV
jgi:hypothetical protein